MVESPRLLGNFRRSLLRASRSREYQMARGEVLGDLDVEGRAFAGQYVLGRVSQIEDDVARALD